MTEALTEGEAGRAAAERLAADWPDRSWIPKTPSSEWARAAIERFAELLREQPAIFRASREGSERGAESLSPRPFQGILESLQNADDVGATELRVRVVNANGPELLLVHDGEPVDLGHAGAMALPWLTTKGEDADASGRFGIGQQTLRSLGGPIEVHCPPYHFALGDDGPVWVQPAADIAGFYSSAARETLIRIRLGAWVESAAVVPFVQGLGARSLLFLSHVRRLTASDTTGASAEHELIADAQDRCRLAVVDHVLDAEWVRLRDPASGGSFDRYSTNVPVTQSERRRNKALASATPIGVAIPRASGDEPGGFFDRLPLPLPSPFPFSLNAQFDPDAARQTILPIAWNERRLHDLGALVAAAAADCAIRDPETAWRGIPLRRDVLEGVDPWLAEQVRVWVVEGSLARLVTELKVQTTHGARPLNEVVFEPQELDRLLTEEDQERLSESRFAISPNVRDPAARWRDVLVELRESTELTVESSLALFDVDDDVLGHRDSAWFVSFASAAIAADASDAFFDKRSILLASRERIVPPWPTEPLTLVIDSPEFSAGRILGVALQIHPAYLDDTEAAKSVLAALRDSRSLVDDVEAPIALFNVLARARSDDVEPIRLDDDRLIALRDAFETLDDDRQRDMGPKIGANIELRGYWFDVRGRRQLGWVRPVDAYLPTAINRETGSFARAAVATPGLRWIDSAYARTLKRAGGRKEVGPQRVLTRLGAATQPRLVRPPNEQSRYVGQRYGSPVSGVQRPALQLREIRAIRPARTYLLGDRWSPDLDAVLADIERDRTAKRRRARGLFLLGVLARAWERHYSEFQSAQAVYDDYQWRDPRDVIATWLARAAEAPWLPGKAGSSRAPIELLLPTDANRLAYGPDSPLFLAAVDDAIVRSPAVAALRIRRGPSASNLLARLRELSALRMTAEVAEEARSIYRLLALAAPADGRGRPVDDVSIAELRSAFAASAGAPGLVLAEDEWLSPDQVLAGPPIFGEHRAFAPYSATLRGLWRLLGIREPTAGDCIAVLRELSEGPLRPSDVGVVLETLRALAAVLPQMPPQQRVQLRKIALWTSAGWSKARPIYAIEDPELAASVANQLATWNHGFTSFAGLEPLIAALHVSLVRKEDFLPAPPTAYHKVDGDRLRPRFAAAVGHLRDELARGDQPLHDSISVPWIELAQADLFIDPDLVLTWSDHSGRVVKVPAGAFMSRNPLRMVARSELELGLADSAGTAIASLFTGDRQKVAWAWTSMWQRAEAGLTPAGVVLSDRGGSDDEEARQRLLRLQGQAAKRRADAANTKGKSVKGSRPRPGPIQVRRLKDIGELEPNHGFIVNEGVMTPGVIFPAATKVSRPEPDGAATGDLESLAASQGAQTEAPTGTMDPKRPPATRSVLPPADEREQLAFDAVQAALALDDPQIADLRARRGIGADAMDDLRQLFEIKMASGRIPNDLTLTQAEAIAAQDPDFFLAVVEGLEDGDVPLSVRFIFKPLRTLAQRITGNVTLSGIRDVEALQFVFGKPIDP